MSVNVFRTLSLRVLPTFVSAALLIGAVVPVRAADPVPGPDSMPQPNVPKGEVLKFGFEKSKIFPGTYRDYWVYVPAQYTPDKPACLYVNQDGVQWNAPTVFDNLIAKKEMPITIGVFVMHGRVKAENAEKALDRFNRSYEYDGLGDAYARFLIEELLPDVETRKASDGRPIRISKDGKDRAIGGASSGAIAAFTAAWERPDSFSRVFSAIGTYVGLRGGDDYPDLIRKYEPKPIRIYLQDGSADQNIYGGDWWVANLMMERALTFAGYEVEHAWGEGGHNGNHGTAIFPDAMRFLWKGWPAPVGKGKSKNTFLNDLQIDKSSWQSIAPQVPLATALAADAKGQIYASGGLHLTPVRLQANGDPEVLSAYPLGVRARAFGPDGRERIVTTKAKLLVAGSDGKPSQVASAEEITDVVVASNGNTYYLEVRESGLFSGNVWLLKPGQKKQLVDSLLDGPSGVTLSPDQTLLYVSESRTRWVYSYQIAPDGTLKNKQRYYWLHLADESGGSGAGPMCVDRDGRLYVATDLGIQVCDQAGRVNCILPLPGGRVTSVTFGGENGDTLYATSGGVVYARKLGVKGAPAWAAPLKPAAPRL